MRSQPGLLTITGERELPQPPPETPSSQEPSTPKASQPWIWGYLQLSLFLLSISGLLTIVITAALYLLAALNLPDISSMADYQPHAASFILDQDNETIGWAFTENRQLADIKDIPKMLINAFLAAEDARFYQHQGVDAWSIVRAFIHNLKDGGRGQGASTITQQVARALLLSPEKTYTRKIKEAILAYRIDKFLSKSDILHIYLNQVYLGEGAYGVTAAASTYFGKPLSELTLGEMAILAGLPQAPSRYSPFKHFERAKARQAYVLNQMAADGYITPTAARKAYISPLLWAAQSGPPAAAEYFAQQVKNYVGDTYGHDLLYQGGLKIHTTLDLELQKDAVNAISQGIKQWQARHPDMAAEPPQAALVCIEAGSGRVLALVGGSGFKASQFNRATQARRQPGSAFKPIIYATAFAKGFTPNSIFEDAPVEFKSGNGIWRPKNYEGRFGGPTSLRNALIHSNNIVTIKLLQTIGPQAAIKTARTLGINSPLVPNLSLALGSSVVSPLELTSAYDAFANGGDHYHPVMIEEITDRQGKLLERTQTTPIKAIDPRVAYQITYLLKGVIAEGTGKNARGIPFSAGKTGTTDQDIDAWFIGYTPKLIAGVWVGYDKLQTLGKRETGGQAAAPIWLAFMQNVSPKYQAEADFKVPEGINFLPVANGDQSGEGNLPGEASPASASDEQTEATVPAAGDDEHLSAPEQKATGDETP